MGYTTYFRGKFKTSRKFTHDEFNYLMQFSKTRRMKRNALAASLLPDTLRRAVNLPIGEDASYFVGGKGLYGQNQDDSVIDYNSPPTDQPGLWCRWIPTDDMNAIEWDGSEKFYNYIEWIEYIIKHFLIPWGIVLNGTVDWHGEDYDDVGTINIRNNIRLIMIELEPIEGEFQEVITNENHLLNQS